MMNNRGTAGSRPRAMRLSISACTTAAFSVAPSMSPSGCFTPLPSMPIAATSTSSPVMWMPSICTTSRSSLDRSEAIHSRMRAAESATKWREAADFDTPLPAGAGTSPSGNRTAIDLFLHACVAGLFDMDWQLVCPMCSDVVESFRSLRKLHTHFHCHLCRSDYDAALDDYITDGEAYLILATHAIVGAATASQIPNHPVIALLAGIASHFAIDAIPHWDYPLVRRRQQRRSRAEPESMTA